MTPAHPGTQNIDLELIMGIFDGFRKNIDSISKLQNLGVSLDNNKSVYKDMQESISQGKKKHADYQANANAEAFQKVMLEFEKRNMKRNNRTLIISCFSLFGTLEILWFNFKHLLGMGNKDLPTYIGSFAIIPILIIILFLERTEASANEEQA